MAEDFPTVPKALPKSKVLPPLENPVAGLHRELEEKRKRSAESPPTAFPTDYDDEPFDRGWRNRVGEGVLFWGWGACLWHAKDSVA